MVQAFTGATCNMHHHKGKTAESNVIPGIDSTQLCCLRFKFSLVFLTYSATALVVFNLSACLV